MNAIQAVDLLGAESVLSGLAKAANDAANGADQLRVAAARWAVAYPEAFTAECNMRRDQRRRARDGRERRHG